MLPRPLHNIRVKLILPIQIRLPERIICSVHTSDFVGNLNLQPEEFREWANSQEKVYRNFLSAVRWRPKEGKRQKEIGSWAFRPEGRFSRYQYHLSPIKDGENLALYCHREYNPVRHPIKHRLEAIQSAEGVKWAKNREFAGQSPEENIR
jgi:hypothetical protein